jgi:hypothetical protein
MSGDWELAGIQNAIKKRTCRERVKDGYYEKRPLRKNLHHLYPYCENGH